MFMFLSLVACQRKERKKYNPLNTSMQGKPLEIKDHLPSFLCQSSVPKEIQINAKKIYQSDSLIENYTYIRLETCEESLIGDIDEMCADENYLFILDKKNQKVLQFDTNGLFIRSLGSCGRGPHEYVGVCNMAIDKNNKEVCLVDAGAGKLLFFNYKGQCVRVEPMYYMFSEMAFVDSFRVHHVDRAHNENIPSVDLFHLIVSDKKQEPLYCDFPMSEIHRQSFYFSLPNPLSVGADGLYYNSPLSDTLWRVTSKGCDAAYVLKFPDRDVSFTNEEVATMSYDDYSKRKKEMDTYGGLLHVTRKFVYFTILDKEQYVSSVLYSRRTGKVRYYGVVQLPQFGKRRLGDYYANSSFDYLFHDSLFVKVLQPYQVLHRFKSGDDNIYYESLRREDRRMLDGWKEEDNPILMLVNPKSF